MWGVLSETFSGEGKEIQVDEGRYPALPKESKAGSGDTRVKEKVGHGIRTVRILPGKKI